MNNHCYRSDTGLTGRWSVLVRSWLGARQTRLGLVCALAVSALVLLLAALTPALAGHDSIPAPSFSRLEANAIPNLSPNLRPAATNLAVSIVSLPWVPVGNKPAAGPTAFVVEAAITNTGAEAATDVIVSLNYQEDPVNNWVLLAGESPTRTVDSLAAGAVYHAYWFARYPDSSGASHQYTVTAIASNASAVATSDNAYGNPSPGQTVQTKTFLGTGNSGAITSTANIAVGVAFTVTVGYDLGSNPQGSSFSPTGNPAYFNAGAYRLEATEVRFYDKNGTLLSASTTDDRLYFPTLDANASSAQVTYRFIAVTVASTQLCPYATISYQSTDKYDQFYCQSATIIPITATLTLSLTKQASALAIRQDQMLTYTLRYTNAGSQSLLYGWIWDDVPPGIGTIITSSIQPSNYDLSETTPSRVAWYLGTIPAGASGTHTFTLLVDGNGSDLADGSAAVNHAFFGINPGSLPHASALTSTVTTTVQAPTIILSKTDGQTTAQAGDALTYTLRITNSGSIAATGLVVTDVLPLEVTPAGSTTPVTTSQVGQTLIWNLSNLAPNGSTVVITIPVTVGIRTLNGTVLTNTMQVAYANEAGHIFALKTTTDTTTVQASILSIAKSDFPDPVLVGRLLTYTLHYTNSGPVTATHAVITDRVPLSTTYQTCSGTACIMSGGVVSWTVGNVAGNTSSSVSFSVLVSESLQTNTVIRNDDYGLTADQAALISGPPVTTLVNRDAAIIDGYTFIDANGNGLKDGGEGPLSGITVTLPGANVPITFTDSAGYYRFRVEFQVPVSVTAELPSGYFRTTPGTVLLASTLGQTQTVNFGYAPAGSSFGVIYGTVFADANHNAIQDMGENGLLGVPVSSDQAVAQTVNANSLGQYTLRYDISGTVRITETNPAFYVSTTPDVVQTSAITGSSGPSPINFGDLMGIRVTGKVFNDANVNGVNDTGEAGVAVATVTADGASAVTGSSGTYTLYVTLADSSPVTIVETAPAGYLSTDAVPGPGTVRVNANTLRIGAPVSGTSTYTGNFGIVSARNAITISGQVWNDNGTCPGCLANGKLDIGDNGESGLVGATVSLNSGLSQTTGPDGFFALYAPAGQAITVTETNPPDYVSTNAIPGANATKLNNDTLLVSALPGGSTSDGNRFGDVLSSTVAVIAGTVFNDQNQSGTLDAGEPGLPGVTVTLEISNVNTLNTLAVLTGPDGHYQFAVAPGTPVRITSAKPGASFYATTPESVVARPPAPGIYPNNNFGYSSNSGVAVISGIVFDDADNNGSLDLGEAGLAGAVITLTNGTTVSVMTSGNGLITGTFTFSVTQPGIYGLHQQNLPGYRSTTPDDINISVTLGSNYFVLFGDTSDNAHSSVYGVVFEDLNGNGRQDNNEPGLPGVVISLTTSGGVMTTTTEAFGQYIPGFAFDVGRHVVSEQDPARPGYHSTTPDTVAVDIQMNRSYIVNFGDVSSQAFSTIMGTVFDDQSGDGVQQVSESGIPGVLVSLSNGMTTTTGDYGLYTFAVPSAGFSTVTETDPAGYHSTTPNAVTLQIGLGQVYVVNFGDSQNPNVASIMGTVFNDQDADGVRDPAELGLTGVTVSLNGASLLYVTNPWGQYTFQIEITGTYAVVETDPSGYRSTTPNAVTLNVTLGNSYQVDYGDVPDSATGFATIYGTVFNDANSNGTQDAGEAGISGVTVTLDGVRTTTTNIYGGYTLSTTVAGAHTVVETDPSGYRSTTPNAVTLNVALGNSYQVDYGDVPDSATGFATIYGTVFNDANGDGVQNNGEPGLSGVTMTMDGARTTTTGLYGGYSFSTTVAGVHAVVETDLPGYFSTTPNTVTLRVALGLSYQVDYGDAQTMSAFAAIYGTVFDDANDNGVQDTNELGIQSVPVMLDGSRTSTTNIYGRYTFSTTVAGQHTITERDLPGYLSTTPNVVPLTVTLNHSYQVDFGDRTLFGCTPDAYEEDNSPALARGLGSGVMAHNFCLDATDWVTFTAQANNVYTITTRAWGQRADTILALYGTDGATLLAMSDDYPNTTDFSSRMVWRAPANGVYYVHITNRGGLIGRDTDYEVWKNEQTYRFIYLPLVMRNYGSVATNLSTHSLLAPLGVITHTLPDAYEVDDTWQQAKPIVPGQVQTHTFDSPTSDYVPDKDYVRFRVFPGSRVTFTVLSATGTIPDLELYSPTGDPYLEGGRWITRSLVLTWTVPDRQYYFIAAFDPGATVPATYTLRMEGLPLLETYLPLVMRAR